MVALLNNIGINLRLAQILYDHLHLLLSEVLLRLAITDRGEGLGQSSCIRDPAHQVLTGDAGRGAVGEIAEG